MKVVAVLLSFGIMAAAAFFLFGKNGAVPQADDGKLRVLTTILPVYCFAANIAGGQAQVENLLPGGVGPHDYQFSPRDLRKMQQADLIVFSGLGLESWLQKAVSATDQTRSRKIIEASDGLDRELIYGKSELELDLKPEPRRGRSHSHSHSKGEAGRSQDRPGPNPHYWLDPQLAAHAVTNILKAFQEADPENAAVYAQNAEAFLERLARLDEELAEELAQLRGPAFITYHNAFPYFVRRYHLNLAGVIEEVPDVQPSIRYLQDLLKIVREKNVKAIFLEPQFSGRLARQMSRDLNVPLAELDPLETGQMEPGAYEDGMRRNAMALKEYLQ